MQALSSPLKTIYKGGLTIVLLQFLFLIQLQAQIPIADLQWFPIADFPASLLPQDVEEFGVVPDNDEGGVWIGANRGGMVEEWDDLREDAEMFNSAKFYMEPEWVNGKVKFGCQMPFRATEIWYTLEFEDGHFTMALVDYFDPNEENLEQMESRMEAGDVCGAVEAVNGLQYPMSYINPEGFFAEALVQAHQNGLAYYKEKNYLQAIEDMECVLKEAWVNFPETQAEYEEDELVMYTISKADYEGILGDHGLFLLRAKEYGRCIEVNENLLVLNPDLIGPRLQLGDAQWATGEEALARDTYEDYVRAMNAAGRGSKVPSRVRERLSQ